MIEFRRTAILIFPIFHAFFVFIDWFYETQKDISLIPTFAWAAMGWAWFLWPVVLIANINIPYIYLAASLFTSIMFIVPTATTIWFVTSVYIFGFAP